MELYINSDGSINGHGGVTDSYPTKCLKAVEPDYKDFIVPMQLRRMSKAVRMGIGASKLALKYMNMERPDAISVGTAMGCLADTEFFLGKLIDQEEQMLTPTAFIQSTHNTVAGQIALLSKCNGHNMTYVHRGHSFEHAMINTQLYLNDNPNEKVLVGGIDELTDGSIGALQKGGIYTSTDIAGDSIIGGENNGAVGGEGASFFVVTDKPLVESAICVKDIYCFSTKDTNIAIEKVEKFVGRYNNDIDTAMLGDSGDKAYRGFYDHLKTQTFKDKCIANFKHLCGEYGVSSAFALSILSTRYWPNDFFVTQRPEEINKVVIVNHFMDYYSCWYVELPV